MHSIHAEEFSFVWVWRCACKVSPRLKHLPQSLHANGFSLRWVRRCACKPIISWKHLLHWVHTNSFSFVWVRRCACKPLLWLKHLLHWLHAYGFSLVWVRRCRCVLYLHCITFAGIKPFVCRICRTTFTRQHSLNYHMLIHQNLTRFTCAECGRMFRHPSHYKVGPSLPGRGVIQRRFWRFS